MVDAGHADECVAIELVVEALLRRRLVQVVQFAEDAFLEVTDDGSGIETARYDARHADEHTEVRQVVADCFAHAGILHLHGDARAIVQGRAVYLADRRRGEGFVFKLAEHLRRRPAELALEHLFHQVV